MRLEIKWSYKFNQRKQASEYECSQFSCYQRHKGDSWSNTNESTQVNILLIFLEGI